MPTFTASESVATGTELDLLRNKPWRTAQIDRVITQLGLFAATLANHVSCFIRVGDRVVADINYADQTAPDPSKLRDVEIFVPAGSVIYVGVTTQTGAIVEYIMLSIEDF
jgi:hypothetical protein